MRISDRIGVSMAGGPEGWDTSRGGGTVVSSCPLLIVHRHTGAMGCRLIPALPGEALFVGEVGRRSLALKMM